MWIIILYILRLCSKTIQDAHKMIFEDINPQEALKILSDMHTTESHTLQYFIMKNFTDIPISHALCHLIASQSAENNENFSLMYSFNSYFTINIPSDPQETSALYFMLASKIYNNYHKNKFSYRTKRLFRDLDIQKSLEETVDTAVNLILAGDKKAENFFLMAIENGRVEPAPYENILKRMAQVGNQKAMGILGEMYLEGRGVEKCVETAMHYFTEGCYKKDPLCYTGMGIIYYREKKNLDLAKKYFEEASLRGSAESDYHLFLVYKEKYRVEDIGLGYLISAANKGYLPALFEYARKLYIQNEKRKSVLYFAALCDFSDSILNGLKYAEKMWLAGNWEQSLMKLMFCAEMGSTNAIYNILYILETKKSYLNDSKKSSLFTKDLCERNIFHFNKLIITMGYKSNFVAMGNCYFYGIGCEVSYQDAFAFYLAASLNKDIEGLYSLSYLYEHGLGVKKNLKTSLKYIWEIGNLDNKAYILVWYVFLKIGFKMILYSLISKTSLLCFFIICLSVFAWYTIRKTPKKKID